MFCAKAEVAQIRKIKKQIFVSSYGPCEMECIKEILKL
ncbi:hypothetical protein LEP1GSC127_1728 [Leptospira kirschneri str. 200801925]|nr:hypothetical protein LEP1GSC127_1728 [Leptospira kirschneri str. 200801925]